MTISVPSKKLSTTYPQLIHIFIRTLINISKNLYTLLLSKPQNCRQQLTTKPNQTFKTKHSKHNLQTRSQKQKPSTKNLSTPTAILPWHTTLYSRRLIPDHSFDATPHFRSKHHPQYLIFTTRPNIHQHNKIFNTSSHLLFQNNLLS